MQIFADDDLEGTWIAFVDTLFNAMFIFACMFVLQALLPHMKSDEVAKQEGIAPGMMCAQIFWPDNMQADVDLWGRGPDRSFVYHKNTHSDLMDYNRDNLGNGDDDEGHHFETICTSSVPKGNWTFNARYYTTHAEPKPADIPVTIVVNFFFGHKRPQIVKHGILHQEGDEITLVDFDTDGTGTVIDGSVNQVYQNFR